MVTNSFLGDLEGFKMGQYVELVHPPCSSGTTTPPSVVVGLLHPLPLPKKSFFDFPTYSPILNPLSRLKSYRSPYPKRAAV